MYSTSGRARALTDAQVRRILQWQRDRRTLFQVAREYGVSPGTIYTVIRNGGRYRRAVPLTDAERCRVLKWWRDRRTLAEVARRYGVSISVIRKVIGSGGRFKTSPVTVAAMPRPELKSRAGRGR